MSVTVVSTLSIQKLFKSKELKINKFQIHPKVAKCNAKLAVKALQGSPKLVMPAKTSLVQGALRLFLSDRNLKRALFETVRGSDIAVSAAAAYFHGKYGAVPSRAATETVVRETLTDMLDSWAAREAVFEAMKTGFTRLTGKRMPLSF